MDEYPAACGSKTNECLPNIAIQRISHSDVGQWTLTVKQHYEVPVCFLALEGEEGLYLKGRHGIDANFLKLPSICHHATPRELPVIVCNTMDEPLYRYDRLVSGSPHARFFVGAPLLVPGHRCIGALCIMDSRPRDSFTLRQSAFLVDSAQQIAAQLSAEVKSFLCLTAESLGSLRPGSGGSSERTATCESLDTVPGEQGQPRTLESLGTCGCQTVDSLAPIPEAAEAEAQQLRPSASAGSLSESDGDGGGERGAAAPQADAAAATVLAEAAATNEEIAPSSMPTSGES